ncbi:SIMPL domain-containing protein [Devosia geojensis]|nr:SIMPL domain-containing protein [Devosia geojensis]
MRLLTGLVPLVLTAGFALPVYAGTISIDGRGEVTAAPDTAFINSGVTTQGNTAREALDANSEAMADLIDALREAGIESRDIQTSGFSVSPNYVYSDERDENGYSLPPKISGYQVSNSVSVRVRDLEALGQILDRSVTVGANTVNGVSFSVADPGDLYDEARRAAFADARRKAELYAEVAGEPLGEIEKIAESQTFDQPPRPMMEAAYARAGDASVPIEGGELTFSIVVQVEWELGNS